MWRKEQYKRYENVCLLLVVTFLVFLCLSLNVLAHASTGNVLINTTIAPSGLHVIDIGGSVNLYFGGVTWSGGQVGLYLSKDGYSSLSSDDVRYGPSFTVAKIKSSTVDSTTYEGYVVGRNWINGTIPKTVRVSGGNYFIKAFDGTSTAVSVTDNYITIRAAFEVVPSYGPGRAPIELKGYALPPNDYANLSYNDGSGWKTIYNLYPADEEGRFTYVMTAPDLAQALPAGLRTESYTAITFRLIVNGTRQTLVYTFNEYKRGLKQVYSSISFNAIAPSGLLYGNDTNFVPDGLYIKVKSTLTITGKWFSPGTVNILWDGAREIGNATADENGVFKTTVTVPLTSEGLHYLLIRDAGVRFMFKAYCLPFVDVRPPVADAGPDQTVNEDTLVTLDGSRSTDDIGIDSYLWTFTDVTTKTLTGISPTYTFTTPGTYIITLKVTDVAGKWDTDELVITVLDVTAPVADAGPDQTVNEDAPVSLDGSNSADNVGVIGYIWTFVDAGTRILTGVKATYTFATPGAYTITLNVSDIVGYWATDTVVVTVLDVTNPIAQAGPNQTVAENTIVSFDASSSRDNVGIVSYEWDFGDGSSGTGSALNHTYTSPGNYTVILTVKDAARNSGTDSVLVTVLRDTDGDRIPDAFDIDDDNDGMPDIWEIENRLDPLNAADASRDNDGDGLTNLQEYSQGMDPNDYFSPLPSWVPAIVVVMLGVLVALIVYSVRIRKPLGGAKKTSETSHGILGMGVLHLLFDKSSSLALNVGLDYRVSDSFFSAPRILLSTSTILRRQ